MSRYALMLSAALVTACDPAHGSDTGTLVEVAWTCQAEGTDREPVPAPYPSIVQVRECIRATECVEIPTIDTGREYVVYCRAGYEVTATYLVW